MKNLIKFFEELVLPKLFKIKQKYRTEKEKIIGDVNILQNDYHKNIIKIEEHVSDNDKDSDLDNILKDI